VSLTHVLSPTSTVYQFPHPGQLPNVETLAAPALISGAFGYAFRRRKDHAPGHMRQSREHEVVAYAYAIRLRRPTGRLASPNHKRWTSRRLGPDAPRDERPGIPRRCGTPVRRRDLGQLAAYASRRRECGRRFTLHRQSIAATSAARGVANRRPSRWLGVGHDERGVGWWTVRAFMGRPSDEGRRSPFLASVRQEFTNEHQ
jgi:hypothetical protein